MKKFFGLVTLLSTFFFVGAQSNINAQVVTTPVQGEFLQLKETEHDFTKIPQGKPVYYTFEIVNIGKTPLKLENVHPSCGCTTPEWSRDPIEPGATEKIK